MPNDDLDRVAKVVGKVAQPNDDNRVSLGERAATCNQIAELASAARQSGQRRRIACAIERAGVRRAVRIEATGPINQGVDRRLIAAEVRWIDSRDAARGVANRLTAIA